MPEKDPRDVIVCGHVLRNERPILRLVRDELDDPTDSGWQAVCGATDHAEDEVPDCGTWTVDELLALEPTLREWIDAPAPIELGRDSASAPWREE